MAVHEIGSQTVPLTLELAKHFDRMTTLKGDRNPDSARGKARVGWLHQLRADGYFYSPTWSTCVVKGEKGRKYRVDGGHSARMLVQSNGDFPDGLMVHVREFQADTIEDAVDLYEQFNQSSSTRTTADLIQNKAAYVEGLEGIKPVYIARAIAGIRTHLKLREGYRDTDTLGFIRLYPDFIRWAADFVHDRHLARVGVVGAMFAMWGHNKELCMEFWAHVREEDAPKGDATRTYADWLDEAEKEALRGRLSAWPPRAYYVKAHHAYNAWRAGITTSLKYHPSAPLPSLVSM